MAHHLLAYYRSISLLVLALMMPIYGQAQQWHVAHPWRASAVIEGRVLEYNSERFLHEFSYQHRNGPAPWEHGLRGTGGSISSKILYFDYRFRQDFSFPDSNLDFMLDLQRSEDFDGSYDRQLVGFRYSLPDTDALPGEGIWQLSLQGDVFADKSQSDIYFGARYVTPRGGWLNAKLVLPDAYLNDKAPDDSTFERAPTSVFLQLKQPFADNGLMVTSLNHTPTTRLNNRTADVLVESEQTRAALHLELPGNLLTWRINAEGEVSRRGSTFAEDTAPRRFRRDMAALTLSATHNHHRYAPTAGVRYMDLREQGWFGLGLDGNGKVDRREPLVFAGIDIPLSDQQVLGPTVYFSYPRVNQRFDNDDWSDTDKQPFIGKISLPWQWQSNAEHGARVTISPSFRLHRVAFGGGNVQVHWPI